MADLKASMDAYAQRTLSELEAIRTELRSGAGGGDHATNMVCPRETVATLKQRKHATHVFAPNGQELPDDHVLCPGGVPLSLSLKSRDDAEKDRDSFTHPLPEDRQFVAVYRGYERNRTGVTSHNVWRRNAVAAPGAASNGAAPAVAPQERTQAPLQASTQAAATPVAQQGNGATPATLSMSDAIGRTIAWARERWGHDLTAAQVMQAAGPGNWNDVLARPRGRLARRGADDRIHAQRAEAAVMTAAAPWTLAPAPDAGALEGAPWPAAISTLLWNRGVRTVAAGEALMGQPGGATDPALMPGLDLAADRLARACRAGERVGIIGDYDVDGLTSSVILAESLEQFGATAEVWLPDRFADGYGPSLAAVDQLHAGGATLLVTADCGTSAYDELMAARALGMDTIVLDHHDPPEQLPTVLALVNHKLPGAAYGSEPAACYIAFKAMRAVQVRLDAGWPQAGEHLALAALGTVCDMVPLTGEQRDLVRHGLPLLQRSQRLGLRMLAQVLGITLATSDELVCGWRLGPCLNAAGRMAHASLAYDLLRAQDAAQAHALAEQLRDLNKQRQVLTEEATATAASLVEGRPGEVALAFAASPEIPTGVAGLVAARLTEQFRAPALALHIDGDRAVGSARSVGNYDVAALMRRHTDLFERFGGHQAAGGCTIRTERLEEARGRLSADAASTLDPEARSEATSAEAELYPELLAGEAGAWLQRMGPFGPGHPRPVLLARDAELVSQRAVGADDAHLAVSFRGGVRGIAFGFGALVGVASHATIVYRPTVDTYRGGMQAEIIAFHAAPRSQKGLA